MPDTTAICLGPRLVLTPPAISGGNSECSSLGSLSSLIVHRAFMPLTLSLLRIFSSFCHPLRCGLPPSVSQSAPESTAQVIRIQALRFRITQAPHSLHNEIDHD